MKTISIYKSATSALVFATKHSFFNQPVRFIRKKDYIQFEHVGIDFEGKYLKFSRCKATNVFTKTIFVEDIELGRFDIEQENEDAVKIYFTK